MPQPVAGSPFQIRGVVEGFYGNPWTHEQRLELVEFIAQRGMNTFVYTPKDDPFVRRRWREPYSVQDLARLGELVEHCRRHDVELVYCVSPGLSIHYSDPHEVDRLIAKFASVEELGVRRFGLLLDDIPLELQHPGDRQALSDLAEAHVRLVNRVFESLKPEWHLSVCPTVYWGRGDEDYVGRLGQGIDPAIDLFWTGRAICSPTLDLADAEVIRCTTGRPVTYWDNYPVNDVAMTFELHIGPYRGRDRQLWKAARGIVANGMELFEASKIPIATIADFLRSPETYDPESSWQVALREVVGEKDYESFALFADNVRSSCLAADDAPTVASAIDTFAFRLDEGDGPSAAGDLGVLGNRLLAAADHLLRGPVDNADLIDECRPWIEAFELGAQAIRRTADLAETGRLEAEATSELGSFLARLRQARVRVFGDAVDMLLTNLTGIHVRPGRHLATEGGGF